MGWECRTYGEGHDCLHAVSGKSEGRLRHRWKDNIKINLH